MPPWDPTKPAGADSANTIDNTVQGNFSALDTALSAITSGVSAAGAIILKAYRAADVYIATFRPDAGDTFDRFKLTLSGIIEWGGGQGATDIILSRAQANILQLASGDVLVYAFDRSTSTVEAVNTAAETDLYSISIPANALSTNRTLLISAMGDYLNNSGADSSVVFKVKYGGTVLLTWASLITEMKNSGTSTRQPWSLRAEIHAKGATNAQVASGVIRIISNPTLVGSVNYPTVGGNMGNTGVAENWGLHLSGAVDSTAAQDLKITVQHGVAHANQSAKKFFVLVQLI